MTDMRLINMKFTPTKQKECELCGELFWPESRNQRCCKKDHFRECPICRSPVKIKYKSDKFKCCSKRCSLELKRRNNLEKWGVDMVVSMDLPSSSTW